MKRFGETWGTPVCDDEAVPVVETPVGEKCFRCEKKVLKDDQGVILPYYGGPDDIREVAYHLDCFLESLGIGRANDNR